MNEKVIDQLFTEMLDLLAEHQDLLWEAGRMLRQDAEDMARMTESLEDARKEALLKDALVYLDGKGYFSFRLHSLVTS